MVYSLSHAISVTEALTVHVHTAVKNAAAAPPLTDTEKAESEVAKMRAMNTLESTIAILDSTLRKLEKPRRQKTAATTKLSVDTLYQTPAALRAQSREPRTLVTAVASNDKLNVAKSLKEQMSPDGMKPAIKTLKDMATAIEPIITSFDKVLVEPYLKKYNASLNTVPVVGIKANKIMYINLKSNSFGALEESWAVFSSLPTDARVAQDANNVFMFPFEGDFCLAIGQKVWRKAHRPDTETDRAKAVDNWPNLYKDEWTKVGDSVLPSADLRGVVPFATLSADRRALDFHLVVLKSDSSLAALAGDSIADGAAFVPLQYNGGGDPAAAPKFVRIAYWDDHIVGYDDANNIWDIKPNFTAKTFSVSDKTPDTAITELTATEVGPITVRDDGFLYKRVVAVKTDGSDKGAAHYNWVKWISQDGVSHLGVASPGVILDLNLLTRTLRSRYIETQTALYPVVNEINAYCKTHNVYLDQVKKAFDSYNSADDDAKKAIAVKQGKAFIGHARAWAKILNESVGGCKESVNIMTSQLSNVHSQLKTQLQILKDKLVGLQATLEAQKEAMSKLMAAFWGMIGAAILGLAIAIIGFESGIALAAGGTLFVGGIVAAAVLGKKMADLAADIADTESQINGVTIAIAEMKSIVDSYDDLDEKYTTLNQFWGRMANDASSLGTLDDATLYLIGAMILEDDSSVVAAQEATSEMGDACTQYLDTLNKQGIKLPEPTALRSVRASRMVLNGNLITSREDEEKLSQDAHDVVFHHYVDSAITRLRIGDYDGYQKEMHNGRAVALAITAAAADLKVKTGLWFDVPSLTSNATVWSGYRVPVVEASAATFGVLVGEDVNIVDAQGKLSGSLDEAKPFVVSMLEQTVSLGRIILQWPRNIDQAHANVDVGAAQRGCKDALKCAAKANNKFSDFHVQATKYQQDLKAGINVKADAIKKEEAATNSAMQNISLPPEIIAEAFIPFAGPFLVEKYISDKKDELRNELAKKVKELDTAIKSMRELQQSGVSFNDRALTWIQMCEGVSGYLGNIYDLITALDGQVVEDNYEIYSSLMEVEWKNVVDDANRVLDLLNVHSPLTISSYLVPSGKMAVSALAARRGGPAAARAAPVASSSLPLVRALSPGENLGMSLKSQAESAVKVFGDLNIISELPYVSGLVAYWDDAKVNRTTLLDVTNRLRNQYVQLVATEYDAIEKLYSLSILQGRRAANVAAGKLPVDVFVKVTSNSFDDVYKLADRTSAEFEKSASDFDDTMAQVKVNLDYIQEQVAKLDVNISKLDKERRDMVYSYIANVIISSISSSLALVSEAQSGIEEPANEKSLPPTIASKIRENAKKGLDVAAMADDLEEALKDLKIEDVVQVIHTLRLVKRDCETTAQQLTAVQPLFQTLVNGLKDVTTSTMESRNELQKILQNVQVVRQFQISAADAEQIANGWREVFGASQSWLDTINDQGISPITFSVQPRAA